MNQRCPVCNSPGIQIRDRVRGGKEIRVYRCEDCFLDFLDIWDETEKVYQFYDGNQYVYKPNITGERMKFNEYDERVKRILPYLNKKSRVLDIGCGDGTFIKRICSYCGQIEGTEITVEHVRKLRSEGFVVWDCLIHEMEPTQPYDIICMFALLEHIPNVIEFLYDLKKRFMHQGTVIFIEVPNLLDPLTSCYNIPEYRDFFYREYHLYSFTKKSLGKLLQKAGFEFECQPLLQASITNHFHWMHQKKGQATTTDMSNVVLPEKPIMDKTPSGKPFIEILDEVDSFYREIMITNGIGDLLACRAWLS